MIAIIFKLIFFNQRKESRNLTSCYPFPIYHMTLGLHFQTPFCWQFVVNVRAACPATQGMGKGPGASEIEGSSRVLGKTSGDPDAGTWIPSRK